MRGGRRSNRRDDLTQRAEINVTSLVDVAFTLLVIFIITAPMLQGGVEIQVPRADVAPLTSEDRPFFVAITRDGTVMLNETEVPIEQLETSLPQMLRAGGVQMVYIKGDSLAEYGHVLRVIATVARTEGIKFGLVAEPPPRR